MLEILKTRMVQGYKTHKFPKELPEMANLFNGLPQIDSGACGTCSLCLDVCPVSAIKKINSKISIDMGKCIFCNQCTEACPKGSIAFSKEFSLSSKNREELLVADGETFLKQREFQANELGLFKKSFNLRVVSAGGCGACEADVNVLNTLTFDLSRFGIHYVASPRHADGMMVTGPVTKNMEVAVQKVYEAIPSPKVVIAVGACAISGGLYADSCENYNGVSDLLPVDLFIPGCPPNPYTILDGLLRLIGRIKRTT